MASERHLRVQRTARFYVLGEAGAGIRELWVACHGYGQLAAPFIRALEPLDDGARIILAPEALSRFYLDDPRKRHGPDSPVGATWMTRVDREHEIGDYVEYLDALTEVVRSEMELRATVVALGFSQGVATVCRWAAFGKTAIQWLILWGGTVPPDLPTEKGDRVFGDASVVLVGGRQDQVVTVAAVERERLALTERGIPCEVVWHDGAHSLHSDTLRRLAAAAQ